MKIIDKKLLFIIGLSVYLNSAMVFADTDRTKIMHAELDNDQPIAPTAFAPGWQDFCTTYKIRRTRSRIIDDEINRYYWQRDRRSDDFPVDDRLESGDFQPAEFGIESKRRLAPYRPTAPPPVRTYTPPLRRRAPSPDDFITFSEPHFAGTSPDHTRISPFNPRSNSYFTVGMEAFQYTYREPGLMRMKNPMYGLYGVLTHRFREHIAWGDWKRNFMIFNFFKVDGRIAYGELDYESDNTGNDDGIPNYSAELRGVIGCDFPVMPSVRITPFFGVGFRYLLDDGGGRLTTTNNWSYDRESHYWYIPAGVESLIKFNDRWSLEWAAEYDHLVYGLQRSHVGDGTPYNYLFSGHPDVENKQNAGTGLRGSLKAMYQHPRLDIVIEPFIRYWAIEQSESKTISHNLVTRTWYEPKNNTTEYGLKFGLRY